MRSLFSAITLVLAGVLGASCSSSHPAKQTEATAPVAVALATVATVEWPARFEAGGTLTARATAPISSRIVAPIATVNVRAGDVVKRGQVLVTLESAELGAQAARATAAVDASQEAANAAAAEARSAEAARALASAAHRRMSTLFAQKSATAQELDEVTAALGMADARSSAAQARVREAAAALEAARSAARAADVSATYGTLVAPFDAVVTERAADPGSMAAPGRTLLVIEDASALTLDVRLDASRAASVRLHDVVSLQIGADSSPWTSGRVHEIARVDPVGQSFLVKIAVPSAASLRSGLFGRARFTGDTREAFVVPVGALIRRGQLAFVLVAGPDDVVRLRAASVGEVDDDRVEVLDGVTAGERVVVSPPAGLKDGARITPAAAPEVRR